MLDSTLTKRAATYSFDALWKNDFAKPAKVPYELTSENHLLRGQYGHRFPHTSSNIRGATITDPNKFEAVAAAKHGTAYRPQRPWEHDVLKPALPERPVILGKNTISITVSVLRRKLLEALVQNDLSQILAVRKRLASYLPQSQRCLELFKSTAAEAPASELFELAALLERDLLQFSAVVKGLRFDRCNAARKYNLFNRCSAKASLSDLAELTLLREEDAFESITTTERLFANGGYTVRNTYLCQLAARKALFADSLQQTSSRKGNPREIFAVSERLLPNGHDARRKGYALYIAVLEPSLSDLLSPVRKYHGLQPPNVWNAYASNHSLLFRQRHCRIAHVIVDVGRAAVFQPHYSKFPAIIEGVLLDSDQRCRERNLL